MTAQVFPLIAGLLAMGYLVAALWFLRFWTRTADRLFLLFSLAFSLLAVQRVASVLAMLWTESSVWLYTLRLAAFVLILIAIVDKNRPRKGAG